MPSCPLPCRRSVCAGTGGVCELGLPVSLIHLLRCRPIERCLIELTPSPTKNNTVFVPSVSASFILSVFVKPSYLSYGKFRASYATTSNEFTNPYQTGVYYSLGNAYNGIPVGSFPTSLPSGLLKPFTTSELELGLDLKFLF